MVALLRELAAAVPRLRGARCRDKWELFDAAATRLHGPAASAQAEALAECRQCPALMLCREWLDSLEPRARPSGVIAGRVIRARH